MTDAAFHEAEAARFAKASAESRYVEQSNSAANTALAHAAVAKSMRLGEIAAALRGEHLGPS